MAQVISADQQVINFAKYWYTGKKFENLLMRNDPYAEVMTKTRIGGQAYRFAAMYGRGGNVSGSAIIATAIANNQSQSRNAEWIVPPGRIFSVFNITQLEMMSTRDSQGAYIKALENKFFAGTEALRKTYAKAQYGYGFGEQAIMGGLYGFGLANTTNNATITNAAAPIAVPTNIANVTAGVGTVGAGQAGFLNIGTWNNGTGVLTVNAVAVVTAITGAVTFASGTFNAFTYQFQNYSDIMGLDIGSVVQFTLPTTTGLPVDGLGANAAFYFNVVGINGLQVQFVSVNAASATPYSPATPVNIATTLFAIQQGSWMVLAGGFDSNGPIFPMGFGGWIPWANNRGVSGTFNPTGAGALNQVTAFNTYIGTSFYNINRSVAPDRLAGGYVMNSSGTAYSDAILEMLRLARRNGARNDDLIILVNDVDFRYIINELGGVSTNKTTYFQSTETGGKSKQQVNKGLSGINWQFLTSWVERIMDTPYLQQGIVYILDNSAVEFASLGNIERPINDGVAENAPGTPDADQMGDGPELNYQLLIDDFLNVAPAPTLAEGPGAQVTLAVYGNIAIHNPAHCVVGRLY
jgi:hypothetical protein